MRMITSGRPWATPVIRMLDRDLRVATGQSQADAHCSIGVDFLGESVADGFDQILAGIALNMACDAGGIGEDEDGSENAVTRK